MAIAKTRHNMGEDKFIITTPKRLTRKFLGVHFINGVGVTKFEERAKRFDEEFGYEVQLPAGFKRWQLAGVKEAPEEELDETTGLDEDENQSEDEG